MQSDALPYFHCEDKDWFFKFFLEDRCGGSVEWQRKKSLLLEIDVLGCVSLVISSRVNKESRKYNLQWE